MHTASREWRDRVAAWNAVEAAKGPAERSSAVRSGAVALAARAWQPELPCRYDDEGGGHAGRVTLPAGGGAAVVPLAAEGKEAR